MDPSHCPNPNCRSCFTAGSDSANCPACGTSIVGNDSSVTTDHTPAPTRGPSKFPETTDLPPGQSASHSPIEHPTQNRGSSSHTAPLPPFVGRFAVRARLGVGAFGDVYRAYDPQLDREVALKVAKPGTLDSPERVGRFVREARAAANLRHPNIVPVFDSGRDEDQFYIASGFIDGRTLDAEVSITDGPLELRRAVTLVRKLAEALGYAHRQGVVHRDVKPANVLVDESGEPSLTDFGLAVRSGDEAVQTLDGRVMGTPAYMSPEQAAGHSSEATAASDQYALGVVLYEMATGQRPFTGPVEAILVGHVSREPQRPRSMNRAIPRDLETVILKCLEKEPARRYPSCEALAEDLRRFLDNEPVKARRIGLFERFGRWCRRNPAIAASVSFGVLALLSGTGAALWQADVAKRQAKIASDTAVVAQQNYKLAREQSFQIVDLMQSAEAEIASVPALHKTRKESLVLVSKACRRYLEEAPDDVELRRRSAQVYRYTANVHRLTNETAAAEALYQDAVRLYQALADNFPNELALRQRVSETLRDQAALQSNLGQLRAATTTLERGAAIAQEIHAVAPLELEPRRALAATLLSLANVQRSRGKYDEAMKTAERATAFFRGLVVLPSGQSHVYDQLLLAAALNMSAVCLRESGQLDAAYEAHKEPIKLADELTKKQTVGLSQPDLLHLLASFRLEQACTWAKYADMPNRRENAGKNMSAAIQQWEALSNSYPGIPMYRGSLGWAYQVRGQLRAEDVQRRVEARADFEESRKWLEALVKESPQLPGPRGHLGRTYYALGNLAQLANEKGAADWFTRSVETLTKAVEQSPDNATNVQWLEEARARLSK